MLSEFRLLIYTWNTHTAHAESLSLSWTNTPLSIAATPEICSAPAPPAAKWAPKLSSKSHDTFPKGFRGLLDTCPNLLTTFCRRRNHQFHQWTLGVMRQQSTITHSRTSRQGPSGSHGTETSSGWIMLKNEKVRRRGREYYWLGKPRPLKQAFLYLLVKIRLSCCERTHPWGCLSSHPTAVQRESLPCWFTQ